LRLASPTQGFARGAAAHYNSLIIPFVNFTPHYYHSDGPLEGSTIIETEEAGDEARAEGASASVLFMAIDSLCASVSLSTSE
jgi:hypothetical protein